MYNFHWFFKLVNTNGTAVSKDETFFCLLDTDVWSCTEMCGFLRPGWPLAVVFFPSLACLKTEPPVGASGREPLLRFQLLEIVGWLRPRDDPKHIHIHLSQNTRLEKNTNRSMPLYSLKTLEVKSISFLSFKWCGRRCPWVGLRRGWGSGGCDCKAGNWRDSSATANQR